jgi:hypothetical protein
MDTPNVLIKATQLIKSNSPQILTAIGVTGVVTTSYLAAKATVEATDIIRANEAVEPPSVDRKQRIKERAKHVWKLYIPTAVSGVATVGCIVSSSRIGARRTAAAVTAYSLTEKAFSNYREKVVEQIGENKEKKIRDEIAQEEISKNIPKQIIVTGDGDVLCCERYTGRYFKSNMEKLQRARNEVNALINNQLYVPLDEFYDLIGLRGTQVSSELGWNSDKLMELEFSTVLSENGEPCLAFEYNYVKPL